MASGPYRLAAAGDKTPWFGGAEAPCIVDFNLEGTAITGTLTWEGAIDGNEANPVAIRATDMITGTPGGAVTNPADGAMYRIEAHGMKVRAHLSAFTSGGPLDVRVAQADR